MIVGDRFEGDNNDVLKWVQHDLYWTLLPMLFLYMKNRYLWATSYTGVDTDLSKKIIEIDRFDHRVLQDAHDKIAAFFRYEFPDKLSQMVIPGTIPDCKELNLEETLKECYRREWTKYWYKEIRKLSNEPIIARAIITAVSYQNTDEGYEAEDLLLELLHDRYGKTWDMSVHSIRELKGKRIEDNMVLPKDPKDVES
jgi:hypothetical protein